MHFQPGLLPLKFFGTGYLLFNSGSGSEVAPEVPACPVLPGRFPVVPTKPWSVVPGLVPAYFRKFVFSVLNSRRF